jgi:hypothetical protein
MNICILEGNLDKAKEIGNKIMANTSVGFVETSHMNNYTNNVSGGCTTQSDMNNNSSNFDFLNEQVNIV